MGTFEVMMALGACAVVGVGRGVAMDGPAPAEALVQPATQESGRDRAERTPEYEKTKGVFLNALAAKRADDASVKARREFMQQPGVSSQAANLPWPEPNRDIQSAYREAERAFRAAGATDAEINELMRAPKPAVERPVAAATLVVGDAAPVLKVERFIKGDPVSAFEKGRIYVIDCWGMGAGTPWVRMVVPKLSELQNKHGDKVTVIGVDVTEHTTYAAQTLDRVKRFVDKHQGKITYAIAYDGAARATNLAYMKASKAQTIPIAFVIDGEGRIAFIGHVGSKMFDSTIEQLISNTFDMENAKNVFSQHGPDAMP